MKRAALAIVSTVAGLVLLLSFKTHSTTAVATPPAAVSSASGGTGSSAVTSPSAGSASRSPKKSPSHSSTATKKPAAVSAAKTYTGNAVDTQYGPVEVQITVKDGKVTAANAVDYPSSDPRDAQINSYAIPALDAEAIRAGSANIDTISGASYTSAGYISSLQSALDKAGL